jgi:hypothetical protein
MQKYNVQYSVQCTAGLKVIVDENKQQAIGEKIAMQLMIIWIRQQVRICGTE